MQFGLSMPNRGPLATPETMREIAVAAEKLGYGYITVSDHIVVPRKIDPNYPYSENGEFRWSSDGETDCMEQFTLLAWIAAVTTKIRVMTSVIVVPHRNPLFMAKSLATTDVLSGGRVTVGCGTGWMPEEFAALNLPDFKSRGQVTNEYIDVMKSAWTDPNPSYEGEFFKFANVDTDPRPVQDPHPPIWIGGESMPAIRRAVSHGDAWYPFGSNPKFRMDTVESYTARLAKLHRTAEAAGRDPAGIALSYNCAFHSAREQQHVDGGRQMVTGTPEQRAGDIRAFAEAGISTMIVNVAAGEKSAMLDRMAEFAENVMPLVG
ncbi:MAG: LLM class F420-dependent oxidoreductase [Rickettsiales bacterium]